MYLPGLPSMARDLGASTSVAQLTISLCLIGLGIGQLIAGPLSDAMGRRCPLLTGLVIYAIASLGCALSPTVAPLLAMRLLQGIAGGVGIVIARAVVRDRCDPDGAARAYTTLMIVGGLGPILAPVAGSLLLHVTDWRGIFVVLALIGTLLLLASIAIVAESLPRSARHGGGLTAVRHSMVILFSDRRFVGHTLAGAFAISTMMAYIAASPFVLENIHHVSPGAFSLVFAINGVGIMVGRQLAMRRLDRSTPATILRAGLSIQAGATLWILATVVIGLGLPALLIGFLLAVGCNGATMPMATALAMADHPERAGSASGLIGFAQFSLASCVAPLVGVGGGATAIPMAIVMPACSLGALLALRLAASVR